MTFTVSTVVANAEGEEVTLRDGVDYSVAIGNGQFRGRFNGQYIAAKSTATDLWFEGEDKTSYISLHWTWVKDIYVIE